MFVQTISFRQVLTLLVLSGAVFACTAGCVSTSSKRPPVYANLPKEMAKTSPLAEYDIGISDMLIVEAVRMVPKSPYLLQASDGVFIRDYGLEDEGFSIAGSYPIQPGGTVVLPPPIGAINIAGLTCEDAGEIIVQKVGKEIGLANTSDIGVSVELVSISGLQPIAGEHAVRADGCIQLGIYGSVHVAGLTLSEAKEAIEFQLSKYLDNPEVAVDVYSFNSKHYYVVMQGAGYGDKLIPFPYTGNETVLHAIAGINGLDRVSSKRVWIARPSLMNYYGQQEYNILAVDWQGITANASPQTNYQLMEEDRIYIAEDKWVAFDTNLSKITAPFERIMGFSLLGAQTATRYSGPVLKGGGNPVGGGN
ncbi:MAG: polysaccharide biosynthesis/export family protein [Planctomycetaceae bacterium]|nr:polysaccharide biosynthesis/export family protein [Planctomycetaceae bacterium]